MSAKENDLGQTPREAGYSAYEQRKFKDACPHPAGSRARQEWEQGWEEAEEFIAGDLGEEDEG